MANDGDLFSLKELKDIAAREPTPQARPARAASTKKKSSILGDAGSLLAELQESVTADAEAEEAARRAAKDAARRAEEEAEAARKAHEEAEVAARLAAEDARRRAAEDEREARRREQDLADRRARGEIIEEDLPAPAPVIHAPAPVQISAPVPLPSRGAGYYLAVIGLPMLCVVAVFAAMLLKPQEPARPELALNTPALPQVTLIESSGFDEVLPVAVATEPPEAAPASEDEVAAADPKGPKRRRVKARTNVKTEKKEEKEKLKINLGGGGITF